MWQNISIQQVEIKTFQCSLFLSKYQKIGFIEDLAVYPSTSATFKTNKSTQILQDKLSARIRGCEHDLHCLWVNN